MMDNLEMWERHDAEQERQLQRLPKCRLCGEPIQEEYFYMIESDCVCESCLAEHFERRTDDYMGD